MRLAVIIPVYGKQDLTSALLEDIERERDLVHAFIVDNRGDFVARGSETVIRPDENLRWLRGTNAGLSAARARGGYSAYVLMNNDTRLSKDFFRELAAAWQGLPGAGVLAPVYDDCFEQQRCSYSGPASEYVPAARHRVVNWVDGTCLFVPESTIKQVGILDETHFGVWGWGADLDYCLRVRAAHLQVYVTELAYLNHIREATVRTVVSDYRKYVDEAYTAMETGMARKWGTNWQERLGAPELRRPQADVRVRRMAVAKRMRGLAAKMKRLVLSGY